MAATLTGAERSKVINKSTVMPTDTERLKIWARNMNVIYNYYTFIIILLGIIGNIISIIVLRNKKMGVNKTSHALIVMTFFNSIYLLSLIPNLLRSNDVIETSMKWTCDKDTYLSLLAVSVTSFEMLLHWAENLILNVYPQHNNKIDLLKHVYFNIIGVPIIAGIITTAVSVQDIHYPNDCNTNSTHLDAPLFNSKNATYAFTIPLVAVIVVVIWTIIGKCWLMHKPAPVSERPQYSSQECIDVWNTLETLANEEGPDNRTDWSVYYEVDRMMCAVSTTSIVYTLPVCIASFFFDVHQSNAPGRWVALQRLLMMLFNTNFGINFFLYCLSGQNFRQELIKCICCRRHVDRQPHIARRDTPRIPRRHIVSNDSIATYHSSSAELQNFTVPPLDIPSEADLVSTLPPPSTPRHEIMELVELGLGHASSIPQIYAGYVIRCLPDEI